MLARSLETEATESSQRSDSSQDHRDQDGPPATVVREDKPTQSHGLFDVGSVVEVLGGTYIGEIAEVIVSSPERCRLRLKDGRETGHISKINLQAGANGANSKPPSVEDQGKLPWAAVVGHPPTLRRYLLWGALRLTAWAGT